MTPDRRVLIERVAFAPNWSKRAGWLLLAVYVVYAGYQLGFSAERFSTGLAAELYADNIAVNALSPTKVVPTPGTIYHHLTSEGAENSEPTSVMAEAALMLCHRDPQSLTGRITYSQELLAELGVPVPQA